MIPRLGGGTHIPKDGASGGSDSLGTAILPRDAVAAALGFQGITSFAATARPLEVSAMFGFTQGMMAGMAGHSGASCTVCSMCPSKVPTH